MPITIGSNIQSLNAQRRLSTSSQQLSKVFERLSSGQRINSASDDAAGLSVVSGLSTGRRVFTQGVRNLNDGVSLLNIADGALEQLGSITVRLKELAEQSANGTYGYKQRKAIDTEAQQLSKEYFRIARSTTFNGQGIFFSEFGQLRLQAGYGVNGGIQSGLGGAIGNGNFAAVTSTSVSGSIDFIFHSATGDLNGDGNLDIVGVGGDLGGSHAYAYVALGRGDGTFGTISTYNESWEAAEGVALGDFNGDGVLDMYTVGISGSYLGQSLSAVRFGRGDGTFASAVSTVENGLAALGVVSGDVNNDGLMDVIHVGQNLDNMGGAFVRLGRSNGTFSTVATLNTGQDVFSSSPSLADINGDGVLDLITAGSDSSNFLSVSTAFGRGDGTFATALTYSTSMSGLTYFYINLTAGDLNGDGRADVVVSGTDQGAQLGVANVYLSNGNGTLAAPVSLTTGVDGTSLGVAIGDINGDGANDLAFAEYDASSVSSFMDIRLGKGNGTFEAARTVANLGGNFVLTMHLGDSNNDGVLDMIAGGLNASSSGGAFTSALARSVDGVSPLLAFDLTTRAGALQAFSQFDRSLSRISTQRGIIGAFQSRITVAGNTLQTSADNYAAAAGRIRDTDVAADSAQLVRTQILQQAASAVLSQANQQPALALQLLSQ